MSGVYGEEEQICLTACAAMTAQKEPVLRQRIFEARYERGYRYLDRCGDAMVILEDLLSEGTGCLWFPAEATPTAARMICPDLDATLVFNAQNLILEQNPVGDMTFDFDQTAADSLALITGRFGLEKMRRFGWRQIKLLPTLDLEEAEELSLKYSRAGDWRHEPSVGLAAREYEEAYRFESDDRDRGIRIAVKPFARVGVELHVDDRLRLPPHHLPTGQREALFEQMRRRRKEREDPDVGLNIDIDFYRMWPTKEHSVVEFAREAKQEAELLERDFLEFPRGKS